MIRAQWISTAARQDRALGWPQVLLICALVISMLVSAASSRVEHGTAKMTVSADLVLDGSDHPVPHSLLDLDCSAHPGCHAAAVVMILQLHSTHDTARVSPIRTQHWAGLSVPPVPHPPNLS